MKGGAKQASTTLIDLTGMRFGKLTVLCVEGKTQHGREAKWICKCDCGAIKSVRSSELRKGVVKSCGCSRFEVKAETNNRGINLVGERFGHLTVLEKAKSGRTKSGKTFSNWLCRCDCGNEKIVRQRDLTERRTESCGCFANASRRKKAIQNYPTSYFTLQSEPTTREIINYVLGEGKNAAPENIQATMKELFRFYWANKVRNEQTTISRRNQRSGEINHCELCGKSCSPQIHHVIPVISFGGNERENIMWLCKECHLAMHEAQTKQEETNAKN